ncbi:MAG: acyl-CoA dehydrogenase family protein [Actinomycetota bacterium]
MNDDLLHEDERELRDLVREVVRDRVAPRAAEIDTTGEFPWDVVEAFREAGIFALPFEERYGGTGTGHLMTLVAIEEISRACATSGLILALQSLGSFALQLSGTDEQNERYVPLLASGAILPAYALTESDAGSDAAAMRTTAKRDEGGYVLDGSKRFITNAGVASVYTVFAKTDPDANHRGISCFLVDADTDGFAVSRVEPKMGIKGSTTGELVFDGCRVPESQRIGEEGEGFTIAMRVLDRSRPGIGAQALGIAQGALDAARAYANERETFGSPIVKHQLVAGMLADMATKTEAARGLLYRVGRMLDAGVDGPALTKTAAMAKLFCSDTAMEVATDAVQVFGGYGFIKEYPVERMMRDAKITQIYEGTNQIQRLVIARELSREP